MKKSTKQIAIFCAALIAFTCQPALAVIIDFEDLPHSDELTGAGTIYSSKGFTLTYGPAADESYPVGFTTVGPSWKFNGRSAAFEANNCNATTTLTSNDNNPMTLKSIDLAAVNGDKNVAVDFIGIKADGSTVQETFQLVGKNVWKKYHLPRGFKNLQSVMWTQGDCINNPPHMFDNIHVTPTWKIDSDD